jgi:hypothetical protein
MSKTETVTLRGPTIVHEEVRFPYEGQIPVTKTERKRLIDEGLIDADPEPAKASEQP